VDFPTRRCLETVPAWGDVLRRFDLRKLGPNNTGIQVLEKLKLREHHALDLIFYTARFPGVFIHTETISQNVFSKNENILSKKGF
jgi:hypothetical protein